MLYDITYYNIYVPTGCKEYKAKSIASEEQSPHSPHCYNCGGGGHLALDWPSPKQEGDKANFANKDDDTASQTSCGTHASY